MNQFDGYRIQATRKREDGTTEHTSELWSHHDDADAAVKRLRASGWADATMIHRGFDFWTAP